MEERAIFNRVIIVFLLLPCFVAPVFAAVPPSSINLSVETSAADLAAIMNQSLPNELYRGQGGLGTSVAVHRAGQVAVTAGDDFVYLALPVQLTFSNFAYESYPIRTTLRFKVKFDVAPDWRIKTELYYTGLSDDLMDAIKLGPISLKPKSMVENVTQPVQRLLAPIVDARVNNAVRLRERVAPVWESAFVPKLVSKEFSTWLRLSPEKIVMSPIRATNNRVQLAIGVITAAEVTVGPKPAAVPLRPLPQVQHLPYFDRSFHVRLGVDIYFTDLVAALNPVLLDKTFGGDKKITVKGFNLRGEDGRLVVVMTTVGDFDGELTVLAKPVYHQDKNTLTFEEVDFDTRNAGWLVSAGSWLFSSSIRSTIKDKLDATVVEQVEKARLKASEKLSNIQLGEHARLAGTVRSLSLGEATVFDDRLSLNVIASGETAVSIK